MDQAKFSILCHFIDVKNSLPAKFIGRRLDVKRVDLPYERTDGSNRNLTISLFTVLPACAREVALPARRICAFIYNIIIGNLMQPETQKITDCVVSHNHRVRTL